MLRDVGAVSLQDTDLIAKAWLVSEIAQLPMNILCPSGAGRFAMSELATSILIRPEAFRPMSVRRRDKFDQETTLGEDLNLK